VGEAGEDEKSNKMALEVASWALGTFLGSL